MGQCDFMLNLKREFFWLPKRQITVEKIQLPAFIPFTANFKMN